MSRQDAFRLFFVGAPSGIHRPNDIGYTPATMPNHQESGQMITMAKGGSSILLFNLRKTLNHRATVISVTVLLGLYVAWQAGSLVWKLWLLENESIQAAALVPLAPEDTEPESLQDLLRYPLIHSASNPTAADSTSIDAPRTSLNLKLVGVMYSTDPKQARAIIASDQDGELSYSIHERVADKAEIYRIEPDRVILLHAGVREALLLNPEDRTSGTQPGAEGQPTSAPDGNPASVGGKSASSGSSANVPKKIDDLMRDFLTTPVMENGNLVGFHLEAVRNPEIMNAWGIDPSDVITAVDGVPLNSQGRLMILYNKLKKRSEFELTLNNGGSSRTVTVDLEE